MNKTKEEKDILSDISNWYGNALSEHQIDSKSVGWKDRASQYLRFQKLFYVLNEQHLDQPLIISDYGAGYGEMFNFLKEKCKVARYDAYEINASMRDMGKSYLNDERVNYFDSSKMLCESDYTFVSGTFNLRMENDNDSWKTFIKETITHLFENSRKGIAFNCLSSYVDWKQENLFYADPKEFFDFCKSNLSKQVALLHDYPLYEWTICLTRNPEK